ncbi:MAG: enoyl-CoA hydratase/isomerase family protein [Burkholderiaceae bacterium]
MTRRFHEAPILPLADHDGAPLIQRTPGFVKLTLNRPAEHNRLDPADVDAMSALFRELASDPAMRGLVITGTGEKTFSSGYTLQALVDELDARFENMLDALEALPFITIAMFNGGIYGGATDMSLCCDLRLGTPGLKMFMPAAKIGLHYYPGGLRRYVSRLGLPAATKLMLTAATIESDEMLRIGFMTEMHPREALEARVDALLDQIGRNEAVVVAKMKRHMHDLAHAGMPAELFVQINSDYRASVESPELRARLDAVLGARKDKGKEESGRG